MTSAEVEELRRRVSEGLQRTPAVGTPEQGGRTDLLVTSTLLSLGFYGYALPLALDIDDGTAFTAMYMLTSGAGFFGPYLWTRNRPVTEGQAKMFRYGGSRGIAHGAFIGMLAFGDEMGTREFMGTGMLTSLVEALAGYRIADAHRMTQGTAETIGVGGDFGLGLGIGTAYLVEENSPDPRLIGGPALIGSLAGQYAGYRLARSTTYTSGDARMLRLLGGLGGLFGVTAADLTGTKNTRSFVAAAMASSLAGLGLARPLLQDKNFSGSDGTYATLGTVGGMLTGLGTAYLLTGDDIEDDLTTPFLTLGFLGGAGGFTLMYRTFADNAQITQTGWRIRFNPGGLAARWLPGSIGSDFSVPFVSVRRTF